MNKQPFYHRAVILFAATTEYTRDEMTELMRNKLRSSVILDVECEEIDAEPGDPSDLIE